MQEIKNPVSHGVLLRIRSKGEDMALVLHPSLEYRVKEMTLCAFLEVSLEVSEETPCHLWLILDTIECLKFGYK